MTDENFIEIPIRNSDTLIKVVGVGGGGGNAVANMQHEGMYDVSMLVCNSDAKALEDSPITDRLQIGPGLGCGGNPNEGKRLAEEHLADIYDSIDPETKMVFITAGMGGGTGTGAAPIFARETKARNILTVGVVTLPFLFEGKRNIDKALNGLEAMSKEVDSILVINNERMRSVYATASVMEAFQKADGVLTLAVKSIVDIIKMHGVINLDFCDVEMVLKEGGVSVISTGYAHGENRITTAINEALKSPLLSDNNIYNARRMVMCITFSDTHNTLMMEELAEINQFIDRFNHYDLEYKYGLAVDNNLKDEVKITILALGLGSKDAPPAQSDEDLWILKSKEERFKHFYEKEVHNANQEKPKRIGTYIFDPNDFDNELVIDTIDTLPPAKRTREDMVKIKQFSKKN